MWPSPTARNVVDENVIDLLVCPGCHGDLRWTVVRRRGGIGGFLPPDPDGAVRDLWAEAEGYLASVVRDDPQLASRLLDVPLTELNPADQYFRAMILEEQGRFAEAADVITFTWPRLYTAPTLAAAEWALTEVVQCAAATSDGPLVDLACGRGQLLERLALSPYAGIVIGTDASLHVLRRNRRWLTHLGLGSRVTLLAVDARRTPFRDSGIPLVTTHLGLDNISPRYACWITPCGIYAAGVAMTSEHPRPNEFDPKLLRGGLFQVTSRCQLYRWRSCCLHRSGPARVASSTPMYAVW